MPTLLPFMKFFPDEYLRDTRPLSLAAKGAWVDILCALHHAPIRGEMTLEPVGWARLIGASVDQAEAVIRELTTNRVCDHEALAGGSVTLICRRMRRERNVTDKTRKRVERWRDKQRRSDGNADDTRNGTGHVTETKRDRDQKPEARSQIEETSSPSSPPAAGDTPGRQDDQVPASAHANPPVLFAEVMEAYNRLCPSMPRAALTELRKKSIRARWQEFLVVTARPLDRFIELFQQAEASDFLAGRAPSGASTWRCTFDWLIGPKNSPKVLEGNYANRRAGPKLEFNLSDNAPTA